jgi:hypothetical protein
MIEQEAAFTHQFFEVAITEGVAQISADAGEDDLGLRVTRLWLRFLPLLFDLSLDLPELSPSLHGHYPTSSLLRDNPPLFAALLLSASRDFRLRIVANEQSI